MTLDAATNYVLEKIHDMPQFMLAKGIQPPEIWLEGPFTVTDLEALAIWLRSKEE
jgi:hypothetical protein